MRLGNGAVDRRVRFNGAIISVEEGKFLIQRNTKSRVLSFWYQEIYSCLGSGWPKVRPEHRII